MIYYQSVSVIINIPGFSEVIIDMIVRHYYFPNLIITDWGLLLISKFWLLLYHFLSIKQKLYTIFYLQINGQTRSQNSMIKAFLQVFVKFD